MHTPDRVYGLLTTSKAYKLACDTMQVAIDKGITQAQDYLNTQVKAHKLPYAVSVAIAACVVGLINDCNTIIESV